MKSAGKRTALITGASGEIGKSLARIFAEAGYDLILHAHQNKQSLLEVAQQAETLGAHVLTTIFDLRNPSSIDAALESLSAGGPIHVDVLINNAGIHDDGLTTLTSDEQFDRVVETNLSGNFYLSKRILKQMCRSRSGAIVNLSSISGQTGNAGQCNYAASKAGIIAMTKSLAQELSPWGIRVNCVAPGIIESPALYKSDATRAYLESIKKMIPLGRFGKPDEVAKVVLFLCSEAASYIQGETISVSGGLYR